MGLFFKDAAERKADELVKNMKKKSGPFGTCVVIGPDGTEFTGSDEASAKRSAYEYYRDKFHREGM